MPDSLRVSPDNTELTYPVLLAVRYKHECDIAFGASAPILSAEQVLSEVLDLGRRTIMAEPSSLPPEAYTSPSR
jgi:hypothetical protein